MVERLYIVNLRKVAVIGRWLVLRGHITMSEIADIFPLAVRPRSPQYQCTYQVWKFIYIYSSYLPETKIQTDGQITVQNLWNCYMSKAKPDLHNFNALTKCCKNPLIFTQIIARKGKYGRTDGRRTGERTHGRTTRNHTTPHYRVAGSVKINKTNVLKLRSS